MIQHYVLKIMRANLILTLEKYEKIILQFDKKTIPKHYIGFKFEYREKASVT